MLTFLVVLFAIIYIIIGSIIGTLCVLMCAVSDGDWMLDYARDLYYKGETDAKRASYIVGTGIASAVILIIWPAYLIWAFLPHEKNKS